MKIDVRALLADACRTLPISYTLTPDSGSDCRNGKLWGVRFPSPMEVKGEIVNTAGYMRMRLDLSLDYVAPCARCLADVAGVFPLTLEKTVVPSELAADMDEDALDECVVIEDGFLDLDAQLWEQVELEFPTRVLCRDDCRGLCPRCGKNLNEGPCDCKPEMDPRLAPFAEILAQMRASETDDAKQNEK